MMTACKNWVVVQNSETIIDITFGRSNAREGAIVHKQKFLDSFRDGNALYNWMIIRDYSSIFAHVYKQKKNLTGSIKCSEGTPVNFDLVVFAFAELGSPAEDLINKVNTMIMDPRRKD